MSASSRDARELSISPGVDVRGPASPAPIATNRVAISSPLVAVRLSMRSDAVANRVRLLEAAIVAIRREGEKVPLITIANDAGVGLGTLYRHFPSRGELLGALTSRAFVLVRDHAREAAESPEPALTALRTFFDAILRDREQLLLPLHGGPTALSDEDVALRAEIRSLLRIVIRRGQRAGTIRSDVTPEDLIIAGAQAAQPLPHIGDWDRVARRQIRLLLDGLSVLGPIQPLGDCIQIPSGNPAKPAP